MTIFARPTSDVTVGSWSTNSGGVTNLFATVDDPVIDDADFIQSQDQPPSGGSAVKVRLGSFANPGAGAVWTLRTRYYKAGGGTGTINLVVNVYQGATLIATRSYANIAATVVEQDVVLAAGEVALITGNPVILDIEYVASTPAVAPPPNIRSVATWESLGATGSTNEYNNNMVPLSQTAASQDMYSLGQYVAGCTSMWRATGKTTPYLDRILTITENLMNTARASSTFPATNVYHDSFLGWFDIGNTEHRAAGATEYWLHDIFYWRHVANMLRHMANNASVMAAYGARHATIYNFLQTHIWDKWQSRSGKFYDAPHILSHWVQVSMCVQALSADSTRRTTAQQIVNECTFQGMGSYAGGNSFGSGVGQSFKSRCTYVNPSFPTAYWWGDMWVPPPMPFAYAGGTSPDWGHAGAVVLMVAEQCDLGLAWTATDKAKFAAMVRDVALRDVTSPYQYSLRIEGNYAEPGDGWMTDGWFTLGRFDVATQQRLETHSNQNIGSITKTYGDGALSAAYLLGTQLP